MGGIKINRVDVVLMKTSKKIKNVKIKWVTSTSKRY